MTYQNEYNTRTSQSLLQIFIYTIDKNQITYNEYYELTGLNRADFTRTMTQFKQMLNTLNIKMNISPGTLPINFRSVF